MTNMYAGMGADDMPTAPYQVTGAVPGGDRRGGRGKGTRSRGTWTLLLLAGCAALGGGTFAVVQAAASSPSPAGPPAASQAAGSQVAGAPAGSAAGQAAVLREVLTTTGIRRLAWLRRLGGMYGQYTFETRQGPRTLAFERGTITSVAGSDVVVRATDGTTWTWTLTSASVVRENGTKEPASALAHGEVVFTGGLVTSGTRNARLIVIRNAATTGKTSATA
jgi:hypothetical protein